MEQVGATTLLASLGLMLVTLLWGLSFAVVKNSLDLVPPVYMMAFRFSIASLALLLVFPKLSAITKETLKKGFVLGIFLALGYALQTIGVVYTSAGKNAFITTTYVIFVPFIYWFFTKHKPGFFSIIPAFVGLLGIALLSLQDDLSVNKGDILTLLCGISYAFHMVFIALFTKDDDPILLNLVQIFFVTVFSWLLAPFYDGAFPLLAIQAPATIWSMLFLGILHDACFSYKHFAKICATRDSLSYNVFRSGIWRLFAWLSWAKSIPTHGFRPFLYLSPSCFHKNHYQRLKAFLVN